MGEDLPARTAAGTRDALGVDRHHDALIAEFLRPFLDDLAPCHGGRIDRNLVRAIGEQRADVVHGAHAAADRQRHKAGFGRPPYHVQHGAAIFMGGVDVEEAKLVRARGIIGDRGFHRIARIAQVDEVDALDHAAVLDVETGDHANLEHYAAARALRMSFSASAGSMRPS